MTDSSDWMLDPQVFQILNRNSGPFSIDLFASRTNSQLPRFCSWRPDPEAWAVDALSVPWKGEHPYMFPPFTLIPRCMDKLRTEAISAVMIAPVWPNQPWFPQLLEHLRDLPVLLPPTQDILTGPDGANHPLVMRGHLPLAAWPVSGDPNDLRDFQTKLSASSGNHGEYPPRRHTPVHGDSGVAGASWSHFSTCERCPGIPRGAI